MYLGEFLILSMFSSEKFRISFDPVMMLIQVMEFSLDSIFIYEYKSEKEVID